MQNITLNDGTVIPQIGLGVFRARDGEQTERHHNSPHSRRHLPLFRAGSRLAADRCDLCFQCQRRNHLDIAARQIDDLAAVVHIPDGNAGTGKRLRVRFAAVQNAALTRIYGAFHDGGRLAGMRIAQQLHTECKCDVNIVEPAVERYRFNPHADILHPHAFALDKLDVCRQLSGIKQHRHIRQAITVAAAVKYAVDLDRDGIGCTAFRTVAIHFKAHKNPPVHSVTGNRSIPLVQNIQEGSIL